MKWKFQFDRDVRLSFAAELKKASWFAGGIVGLTGFVRRSFLGIALTSLVWLGLQLLAHVLLALHDKKEGLGDHR
jgi:hypothetical protein